MINGNTLIIILCIIIIVLIYIHYKKTESYTIGSIDFSWRNGMVDGVTKWILIGEFPSLEGDGTRTITKEYTDPSLLKNYTDVSVNLLKDTVFDYKISTGKVKLTLYYNAKDVNNKIAFKEFTVNKDEITLTKSQLTKVEGPEIKWPNVADNLPEEGWYQIQGRVREKTWNGKNEYLSNTRYIYYVDENNKLKTAGLMPERMDENHVPSIQFSCSTLFYLSYKNTTGKDRGKSSAFQLQTVTGQKIDSDALKWCIVGEDKSITCSSVSKPEKGVFKLYTEERGEDNSHKNSYPTFKTNIIGKNPGDDDTEGSYCTVGIKMVNNYIKSSRETQKFQSVCNTSETKDIIEDVNFVKFDIDKIDNSITMDQIYAAQDLLGIKRDYDMHHVNYKVAAKLKDATTQDEKDKINNAKGILTSIHGFFNGSCNPKTYKTKIAEKITADKTRADFENKYSHIVKGKDLPIGLEQLPTFYVHIPPDTKENQLEYKNQGTKSKILINENTLKLSNNKSGTKAGISGSITFFDNQTFQKKEGKERSVVLVFSTSSDVDMPQTLIDGKLHQIIYPGSFEEGTGIHRVADRSIWAKGSIGVKEGKIMVDGRMTELVVSKYEWHIMIITQKQTHEGDTYRGEVENNSRRDATREFRLDNAEDIGNQGQTIIRKRYRRFPEYATKITLISDKTVSSDTPLFETQEEILEFTTTENHPTLLYPGIPDKISSVTPCIDGMISSFAYFDVVLTKDEITYLTDYYKAKKTDSVLSKDAIGESSGDASPTFKEDSSTWTWDNLNKKLKLNTTIQNTDKVDDYSLIICDMNDNYSASGLGLSWPNYKSNDEIINATPVHLLKYRIKASVNIQPNESVDIELVTDKLTMSVGNHKFMAMIVRRRRLEGIGTGTVKDEILVTRQETMPKVWDFISKSKAIKTNVRNFYSKSGAKYRYEIYANDNFSRLHKGYSETPKIVIPLIAYLKNDLDEGKLEYGYVREEYNDRNQPEVDSPVKVPVYNETTKKMELSDKSFSLPDKDDVPRYTSSDTHKALIRYKADKSKFLNGNKTGIPNHTLFNTNGAYPYIDGNSKVYSYDGYHNFVWDDVLKTEPMFTIYSDSKIGKGIVFNYLDARFRINVTVKEILQSDNTSTEIYKTNYTTFSNSKIPLPDEYNQTVLQSYGDDGGVEETNRRSDVRHSHQTMWQSVNTNLGAARHFWQILPFNPKQPKYTSTTTVGVNTLVFSGVAWDWGGNEASYNYDDVYTGSEKLNSLESPKFETGAFSYSSLPERRKSETLYPINDIGDNPTRPVDRFRGKRAHEAFKQGQYGSSVSISDDIMVIGAPNTGKGKRMTLKVKDGTTNVIEFDSDGKPKNNILTTKEIYEWENSGAAFIMKRDSKDGEWYNIDIIRGGNNGDRTGTAVSIDKGYIAITSPGDRDYISSRKPGKDVIEWAIENVDGITESMFYSDKKYKTEFTDAEKESPWEAIISSPMRSGGDDALGRRNVGKKQTILFGYKDENGRKIYADKFGVRYLDGDYDEVIDKDRTDFTDEEKLGDPWKMAFYGILPWDMDSMYDQYTDDKYSGYKNANGDRLWKHRDGFIRNIDIEGPPLVIPSGVDTARDVYYLDMRGSPMVEDVNGEYVISLENLKSEEKRKQILYDFKRKVVDRYDDDKTEYWSSKDVPLESMGSKQMADKYESVRTYSSRGRGSVMFLRVNKYNEIEYFPDLVIDEHRGGKPFYGNGTGGFGASVSICVQNDGSVLAAVGSTRPHGKNNKTAENDVYIFKKSRTGKKFVKVKELNVPASGWNAYNSEFGASVSISEGKVLIGAPGLNEGKGAAFIYYMDPRNSYDWGTGKMITPKENDVYDDDYTFSISLEKGDRFGASVSFSNDVMAIGAPGKSMSSRSNQKLENVGCVYIYDKLKDTEESKGKWAQSFILPHINSRHTPSLSRYDLADGLPSQTGKPGDDEINVIKTKANEYNAEDYSNIKWYTTNDEEGEWMGGSNMMFGSSVSIDDGKLVVGAPNTMVYNNRSFEEDEASFTSGRNNTGRVTTYSRNAETGQWGIDQRYQDVLGQAESIEQKSRFGTSVDVDSAGNQIAIGVPGYTPFYNRKENTGRAMVYSLANRLDRYREPEERHFCHSMVRFVDKDNTSETAKKYNESDSPPSTILKNNDRIGPIDDEIEYMTIHSVGYDGIYKNGWNRGFNDCENMMPNTPPPPVPTFNKKLSVIVKTVTFKITDITNLHESYSIQLEREDGTVLKTQKIGKEDMKEVDEKGKSVREWKNGAWRWTTSDPTYKYIDSFTWEITEPSYKTYNYVIKLIYTDKASNTKDIITTSTHTLEIKEVVGRCLGDIDSHCGIKYPYGGCQRQGILKNAFRDKDLEYVTVSSKDDDDNNKYESFKNAAKALSENPEILKKYKQKIMDVIKEPVKNSLLNLYRYDIELDDGTKVKPTTEMLYDDTGVWQPDWRYENWHIKEIYVKPENYMKDGKKYYYFDLYFRIGIQYTKRHGSVDWNDNVCDAKTDTGKFVEPDITITPAVQLVTFDIKLRSMYGSYKVEAKLKNIANPDPSYTVSFHNTKGEQVASHTFKSSDTEVTMEWPEQSGSGTKEYTVKLNGTTSSTASLFYCGGGRKSRVCDL